MYDLDTLLRATETGGQRRPMGLCGFGRTLPFSLTFVRDSTA